MWELRGKPFSDCSSLSVSVGSSSGSLSYRPTGTTATPPTIEGERRKTFCPTPNCVCTTKMRQTLSRLNRGGRLSSPGVPKQTQALPLWPTTHSKHGGELPMVGASAEETCSRHSTKSSLATVTQVWQEKMPFHINVWR